MNAYDKWLEAPYQEASSYDDALETAREIEESCLAHELSIKPSARIELFDEACGYRTADQADAITKAYRNKDAAAMLAVVTAMLDAQFERTVELRAIKECA